MPIRWHDESPDDLRESIRYTAEQTGFAPGLIEKDYWCSVLLEALAGADTKLVFKGGTSLAKIHSGFFRLSEDLDFSIPAGPETTRTERRNAITPIKALITSLRSSIPALESVTALEGHNASTQYNAAVRYPSVLAPHPATIAIEIGIRERVLVPSQQGQVRTAVLHWSRGDALVDPFAIRCLSYPEAMAEKLRAALARPEVAIRDFFDVEHAVRVARFNPADPSLLQLLRLKLEVEGTAAVDVSPERTERLRPQLNTHLRPVLRAHEFEQFDLDRAIAIVRDVADRLRATR